MSAFDRRKFLQTAGLSSIPLLIPGTNAFGHTSGYTHPVDGTPDVKLFGDGEMFDVTTYIEELKKINTAKAIEPDRYAAGGVVEALEKAIKEFKEIYQNS